MDLPFFQLANDAQWRTRAKGLCRIALESGIRQVWVVLHCARRLDEIDALWPISRSQLGAPSRGIQRASEVDEVGRAGRWAEVGRVAGFDEVAESEVSAGSVIMGPLCDLVKNFQRFA